MSAVSRPPRATDGRWYPRRLLESPHRLAFGAGASMLAAAALWWAWSLLRLVPAGALPRTPVHGLLMAWGFLPLFIAGFLFTAAPRWLGCAPVAARTLLPALGAQLAGWVIAGLALVGGGADGPLLLGMGLAAVAAGWSSLVLRFWRLVRAGTAGDRLHLRVALAACVAGALLLDATVAAVMAEAWTLVSMLTQAALWGCFGVVYAAMLHRLLPVFGAAVPARLEERWPHGPLWMLAGILAFQALATAATLLAAGPWSPAWRLLAGGVQGAAGLLLLGLAWRWSRLQRLSQRLPAMLQRGLVWLGLALLLSAAGAPGAALHAYALGFLGTTLLAMASRVTCGHAGRAVVADGVLWTLHQVLQAVVVARMAAALWPAVAHWLLPLAALGWAAVGLGWLLRYGPWLGQGRVPPTRGT
ncbi:NnrS family protein [Azohydromonas caseinilytica]|uniref:NnrS family protein n=1 Tax=Azohydromonas caseinilytica TaxID=2728836 RepID=A0A848F7X7_9BURK|nr:NnrS family protein [Azohydromonas caseinilytica]NML14443.1 NnrS family protein [Azohydromonas caseinilytica]